MNDIEKFIIKNYIHHNLISILDRARKIYPETFTDELYVQEMQKIDDYVKKIYFDRKNTECESLNGKVSKKKEIDTDNVQGPNIVEVNQTNCLKSTDTSGSMQQNISVETLEAQHPKRIPPTINGITSCRCVARVVDNEKTAKSTDIINIDSKTGQKIYGRQCKNTISDGNDRFCGIHTKTLPYGIFHEDPSDNVKNIIEKKFNRVRNNEG